ncbi:MAG: NfeD family protein [Verrucomicrobiales bacterium]
MLDSALLWFIAGMILIILEFGAPGVVLCFFGIGALLTASTTWLGLTPSISLQLAVFTLSSVALLLGLRRYVKTWFVGDSEDLTEDIEDEYSGREVTALTDFESGKGVVEMKGARWNARSDAPIRQGETVMVSKREDLTLYVTPRSKSFS